MTTDHKPPEENSADRHPAQPNRPEDKPVDENYVIAHRREKLEKLRATGQAFPNTFRRDTSAEFLQQSFEGRDAAFLELHTEIYRLAGRLVAKRIMGKASFAQLQDFSGRIQLFVQQEGVGAERYADFKTYDVGDIVGVTGRVFRTKTNELSVKIFSIELLVKSLRALPEKWAGLTDTETRYRQRYVDLIINPEVREVFRRRAAIVQFIRQFFDSIGFLEVETPMLQPLPGGATARPFTTHHNALDRALYLRIAPELYLKRLVVGGFERVYEINRNFRNEGLSTRHNPEFTMLEFYQAYADYADAMDLLETLVRDCAAAVLGTTTLTYQGAEFDLGKPFARLTMEQAVMLHNPELDASRLRHRTYLLEVAKDKGIPVPAQAGVGKLLTELFEKTAEAKLLQPTFITAYPTEVSPLARRNDADPEVTDRFELFVAGRELANGFSELNDADDQAARFRAQVAAKEAGDDEAMLFDADYVRALEYGLPPTAGVGMGIDRLAMFFTDSASIRDVLLFPQMRPEAQAT